MSVNGIWKIEMLGPYGWESVATAFFEDGRYLSGSQDHYTQGQYSIDGNHIEVTGVMRAHGQVRTLFGKQREVMDISFDGQIDGDQIQGQARDDDGVYLISFRAVRLDDL